jgi:hypothetical protein
VECGVGVEGGGCGCVSVVFLVDSVFWEGVVGFCLVIGVRLWVVL